VIMRRSGMYVDRVSRYPEHAVKARADALADAFYPLLADRDS